MLMAIWLKAGGDPLAQSSWRSEPQVDQYSRRCTPGLPAARIGFDAPSTARGQPGDCQTSVRLQRVGPFIANSLGAVPQPGWLTRLPPQGAREQSPAAYGYTGITTRIEDSRCSLHPLTLTSKSSSRLKRRLLPRRRKGGQLPRARGPRWLGPARPIPRLVLRLLRSRLRMNFAGGASRRPNLQ